MPIVVTGRWGKKVRVSSCQSQEKAIGVWTPRERVWGRGEPALQHGRQETKQEETLLKGLCHCHLWIFMSACQRSVIFSVQIFCQPRPFVKLHQTLLCSILRAERTAYSHQPGKQWPGSRREWGMQLRCGQNGWQRWQAAAVRRVELPPSVQFWWRDNFAHCPTDEETTLHTALLSDRTCLTQPFQSHIRDAVLSNYYVPGSILNFLIC